MAVIGRHIAVTLRRTGTDNFDQPSARIIAVCHSLSSIDRHRHHERDDAAIGALWPEGGWVFLYHEDSVSLEARDQFIKA